ncbi:MAG: DUF4838 domain-containing protein [Ruminococcaceae bacterium]|nr:DUF4838 domain-containing protein [Oscillospiraceae bacterium]
MFSIYKVTSNRTIDYAAEELAKYLRMMMPEGGAAKISYHPTATDGFRIGLMEDFGLEMPEIQDPVWDELLYIETKGRTGIIAGANPRSVLLAVYEYFRQNGCRWLMTGVDGEYIPMKEVESVSYRFKPDCRFRAWGNEGSQSQQSMLDMIEFAPKIGMNCVYIQGEIPATWHHFYYHHRHNEELKPKETVSDQQVLQWKMQCEAEINKRGLIYMSGGHGYVMEPFGISSATFDPKQDKIPEDAVQYLAQLDGERKLYKDKPNYTNFCMSNPTAREKVADYIVAYLERHSNLDIFNFPLADLDNNYCECEVCRTKRPSDWYVMLLNRIDDKLIEKGIDTKIRPYAYVDSIWAPVSETFHHPERFIMGYSPISRHYQHTMSGDPKKGKVEPYRLNKNVLPTNEDDYYAYLAEWRKVISIPTIASEYHFWAHFFFDPSSFALAKRLYEDIPMYKKCGIDGIMHFVSMHNAFPNGYAFYLNARKQFDLSADLEQIKEDYFSHAYGEHYKEVMALFDEVEEHFDFAWLESQKGLNGTAYYNPPRAEKFRQGAKLCEKGLALCEKIGNSPYRIHGESKKILHYYSLYLKHISEIYALKADGKGEEAYAAFDKMRLEFGHYESEIEQHYDHFLTMQAVWYIVNNMDKIIV